jgi:PAS domain S-box-containing protein
MALSEGVVIQDREGRVVAANPAAARLIGLNDGDLIGLTSFDPRWEAVREDGSPLPGEEHPAMVALRTGQTQRDTVVGVHKPDHSVTWLSVHSEPVFLPGENSPHAVVTSFTDITHSRHARQALELAKQQAEESGRVKDKFVSLLAHDLRAPIAAAMSMVQMVSSDTEPPLPDPQRETLRTVHDRLAQQLTLIEEVLKMTGLRTGKLRVHKRRVPAGVLIAGAMGLRFQAERKGVRLVNEVGDSLQLAADPVLFGQVMQNLVSNAIKFSKPGSAVRLFAPGDRPDTLAVQDSGVGIDPKRAADLFRSDVKTSTVGTAGERGTGLGLPLSHDIVAAHGGTLRVEI